MLIDLHCHTYPLSDDSFLTPDQMIEGAKAAGLGGICLTEHDFVWDPKKVQELSEKHEFLVLHGMELNTEEGHVLAFGFDKYVYGMHRVKDLSRMMEEAGGAIVASHPYRRQLPYYIKDDGEYRQALERASRNPVYSIVCGLEEVNGRGSEKENAFSRDLRQLMSLPGCAGSDAHDKKDIARCATEFDAEIRSVAGLIRELKAGRFRAVDLRQQSAK